MDIFDLIVSQWNLPSPSYFDVYYLRIALWKIVSKALDKVRVMEDGYWLKNKSDGGLLAKH
jgi:hypothetical protein